MAGSIFMICNNYYYIIVMLTIIIIIIIIIIIVQCFRVLLIQFCTFIWFIRGGKNKVDS